MNFPFTGVPSRNLTSPEVKTLFSSVSYQERFSFMGKSVIRLELCFAYGVRLGRGNREGSSRELRTSDRPGVGLRKSVLRLCGIDDLCSFVMCPGEVMWASFCSSGPLVCPFAALPHPRPVAIA